MEGAVRIKRLSPSCVFSFPLRETVVSHCFPGRNIPLLVVSLRLIVFKGPTCRFSSSSSLCNHLMHHLHDPSNVTLENLTSTNVFLCLPMSSSRSSTVHGTSWTIKTRSSKLVSMPKSLVIHCKVLGPIGLVPVQLVMRDSSSNPVVALKRSFIDFAVIWHRRASRSR